MPGERYRAREIRAAARSSARSSARPSSPGLTADAVWIEGGRVLLVRRGRPPFRGRWALPGGFVEGDEPVEAAVARELLEETGLAARPVRLVGVYSGPGRDPRGPTVSVAYRMAGVVGAPSGGDDAAAAAWVSIRRHPPLAFDHARILNDALAQNRAVRTSSPPPLPPPPEGRGRRFR